MTALEVRPDGIFLIADLPEEPPVMASIYQDEFALRTYNKALASAKQSAIRVEDQDAATELLIKSGVYVSMEAGKPLIDPGIYPIPGLKWERTTRSIGGSKLDFEFVAVLSPSSIETTEQKGSLSLENQLMNALGSLTIAQDRIKELESQLETSKVEGVSETAEATIIQLKQELANLKDDPYRAGYANGCRNADMELLDKIAKLEKEYAELLFQFNSLDAEVDAAQFKSPSVVEQNQDELKFEEDIHRLANWIRVNEPSYHSNLELLINDYMMKMGRWMFRNLTSKFPDKKPSPVNLNPSKD